MQSSRRKRDQTLFSDSADWKDGCFSVHVELLRVSSLNDWFIHYIYLVYAEQNYLDHDLNDINLDRDPEDAPVYTDIHCLITVWWSRHHNPSNISIKIIQIKCLHATKILDQDCNPENFTGCKRGIRVVFHHQRLSAININLGLGNKTLFLHLTPGDCYSTCPHRQFDALPSKLLESGCTVKLLP